MYTVCWSRCATILPVRLQRVSFCGLNACAARTCSSMMNCGKRCTGLTIRLNSDCLSLESLNFCCITNHVFLCDVYRVTYPTW